MSVVTCVRWYLRNNNNSPIVGNSVMMMLGNSQGWGIPCWRTQNYPKTRSHFDYPDKRQSVSPLAVRSAAWVMHMSDLVYRWARTNQSHHRRDVTDDDTSGAAAAAARRFQLSSVHGGSLIPRGKSTRHEMMPSCTLIHITTDTLPYTLTTIYCPQYNWFSSP